MARFDFSIKAEKVNTKVLSVRIEGDVDLYRAPEIEEAFTALIAKGWKHLVVNLEHVSFIDTTGIGLMIGVLRKVKTQGGTLKIVCKNERLTKMIEALRLTPVLQIFGTMKEAIQLSQNTRLLATG